MYNNPSIVTIAICPPACIPLRLEPPQETSLIIFGLLFWSLIVTCVKVLVLVLFPNPNWPNELNPHVYNNPSVVTIAVYQLPQDTCLIFFPVIFCVTSWKLFWLIILFNPNWPATFNPHVYNNPSVVTTAICPPSVEMWPVKYTPPYDTCLIDFGLLFWSLTVTCVKVLVLKSVVWPNPSWPFVLLPVVYNKPSVVTTAEFQLPKDTCLIFFPGIVQIKNFPSVLLVVPNPNWPLYGSELFGFCPHINK